MRISPVLVLVFVLVPVTAAAERSSNTVDVSVAATQSADAAAVRADLRELLGRIGVMARYQEVPAIDPKQVLKPDVDAPDALARVWLDLAVASPARAAVYLADAKWERVLVRYVSLARGIDEVARQEISHIVASAIDALRSGGELGLGDEGEVILASEPPPSPSPEGGVWLVAGLAGGVERWSSAQVAVPALGASLTLGWRGPALDPAIWLSAGYHAADTAGDPVSLRLRGGGVSIVGLAGFGGGGPVSLRMGAGPGADLLSATPVVMGTPAGVQLDPQRWVPTFFLRTAARVDYQPAPAFVVFLAALCDVQIATSRYTVERAGSVEPVFQPARLRPAVMLGVEAKMFGRRLD